MWDSIQCPRSGDGGDRPLGAWCKTRPALRAGLFRQLYVAKSSKDSSMSAVLRLDLAKNLSLSPAGEFHTSLLGVWRKTRSALRADLFRQLCVVESSKDSSMPAVLHLDLAKYLSLSPAGEIHTGLLGKVVTACYYPPLGATRPAIPAPARRPRLLLRSLSRHLGCRQKRTRPACQKIQSTSLDPQIAPPAPPPILARRGAD